MMAQPGCTCGEPSPGDAEGPAPSICRAPDIGAAAPARAGEAGKQKATWSRRVTGLRFLRINSPVCRPGGGRLPGAPLMSSASQGSLAGVRRGDDRV